jgi:hypothetical protein
VAYDNNNNKPFDEKRNTESIFSKRIKAGKRRTYFFDVRETRGSDYFITITESKKRFNDDGYDRHKMFIYKEDFNKFLAALTETVDYVKTELMPDFDFDAFNHDESEEGREYSSETVTTSLVAETEVATQIADSTPIAAADDDSGMDAWKI